MSPRLTLEQMESAFWLVAHDMGFIFIKQNPDKFPHDSTTTEVVVFERSGYNYEVGLNLNDTFFYSTADTETISWDEIVPFVDTLRSFDSDDDRWLYITYRAVEIRGHDPHVEEVKLKLDDFRNRYPHLKKVG